MFYNILQESFYNKKIWEQPIAYFPFIVIWVSDNKHKENFSMYV
jgi:hypothetical protein